MYFFISFVFPLHLYTTYITTAKISIIVFICLFQDSYLELIICFPN